MIEEDRGVANDLLCNADGNQLERSEAHRSPSADLSGMAACSQDMDTAEVMQSHGSHWNASSTESRGKEPATIGDEDYVDERQLMEYLRQLEMEKSEQLLLLEAAPESSCRETSHVSVSTGARPKVSASIVDSFYGLICDLNTVRGFF
jgi:hypothetical protein